MAGLNELCKLSFGGHAERATLENGSPSSGRVSDLRRGRDWGSNPSTGGHQQPYSYTSEDCVRAIILD